MASSPTFDEDLRESFLKVEDELLDAVLTGSESSTADFIDRLSSLTQSVVHGIAYRLVSSRTLSLVHRVASNANVLAHNLRELGPRTKSVETKRQDDLSALFARFSMSEKDTQAHPHTLGTKCRRKNKTSLQRKRYPSTKGNTHLERSASEETLVPTDSEYDVETLPLHISQGFCWLIKNLHDPYPSRREKASMAEISGVPIRTIETWFVNTRRRIGWTSLLDSHFQGSRAIMVDTAHRVYENWGDGLVSEDVSQQFLRIRSTLMGLFEGRMEASNLAKKLEDVDYLIKARDEDRPEPKLAARKRKRKSNNTVKHDTIPDDLLTCSNVDTSLEADASVQAKCQCSLGNNVFYNSDSSPSLTSSSSMPSSPYTLELLPVDPSSAHSSDSFTQSGLMVKSSALQEADLLAVGSNYKRHREADEGEHRSTKRSRVNTQEPKYASDPATAIDASSVSDCSTELSQLWSLDFSIPTGVALDQISGGSLDLDVHDWSKCLDTGSLGLDLVGGDTIYGSIPESASHSRGSNNHNTEDFFGELLQGLQTESILPVSDLWNSQVYPEVGQVLTGLDVAALGTHCDANATISPTPSIVDIFSLNDVDDQASCSMAHSYEAVTDLSERCFDFRGSKLPVESGMSLMENYEAMVNEMLRSDRDAKLERLRLLKEEKDRLAEEERRLEEDLNFPDVFTK